MAHDQVEAMQEGARRAMGLGGGREVVYTGEHPPTITLGLSAKAEHLLHPLDEIRSRGIDVTAVRRGGGVTVHCPGQLMIYPVLSLRRRGLAIRAYMEHLAAAMAAVLAGLDLMAHYDPKRPGLWVGQDKISSLGIHVSRGIAIYGASLNLDPDLKLFDMVIPCGLEGVRMTSVKEKVGASPRPAELARPLVEALSRELGSPFDLDQAP